MRRTTSFIAGNCLLKYSHLVERMLPEILARIMNPTEYLYLLVVIDEKRGKTVLFTLRQPLLWRKSNKEIERGSSFLRYFPGNPRGDKLGLR
jgi:hypothetical protein